MWNELISNTMRMAGQIAAILILMANQKEKYIAKRMHLSKAEFMQYSFEILLLSIKKGGA